MAQKELWLQKAEDWLAKRANAVTFWNNGEAIVYLECRRLEYEHRRETLNELWESECKANETINRKRLSEKIHPITGVRVESDPRFWFLQPAAGNHDTIDATMMRVADCALLDTSQEFWRKVCDHLCWESDKHFIFEEGVEFSQSEIPARILFSLCRSDLALREMPEALRAWLREVLRGKLEPAEPWVVYRLHPDDYSYEPDLDIDRDRERFFKLESVAIAAAIAFGNLRMPGSGGKDSIIAAAGRFLVDKQLPSGAWPRIACVEENDSVLHTAMAIHALWFGRPNGWETALKQGAVWLQDQQDSCGYWYQPESEPTFLTVLVLDALELARKRKTKHITFKLAPAGAVPRRRQKKSGKRAAPNRLPEEVTDRLKTLPAKNEKYREMKMIVWENRRHPAADIARLVETETGISVSESRIRQIRIEVNKFFASGVPDKLRPEHLSAIKRIVNRLKKIYESSFSQEQWREWVGDLKNEKYGDLFLSITAEFLSTNDPERAKKAGRKFLDDRRRDAKKTDFGVDPDTSQPYDSSLA
jgi:hypothetical protein